MDEKENSANVYKNKRVTEPKSEVLRNMTIEDDERASEFTHKECACMDRILMGMDDSYVLGFPESAFAADNSINMIMGHLATADLVSCERDLPRVSRVTNGIHGIEICMLANVNKFLLF